MRLDKVAVDRYLEILRDIGGSVRLTDAHAHPFEVLFDEGRYALNPHHAGVYSTGEVCYLPPASAAIHLEPPAAPPPGGIPDLRERMLLLAMRRLYVHTGPRVWGEETAMAGIGRTVLLPVAPPGRTAEARMAEAAAMFGGDPRFLLGYSLPNTLEPVAVEADVRRAAALYGIEVLKVHPNLSGHDLTAAEGRERLEALLAASGRTALPVIIHGGPSPLAPDRGAAHFADIEHLARLDFGLTDRPVVIAHAGAYSLEAGEAEHRVLPRLLSLLNRFPHLLVDISALPADVLSIILEKVEPERIVFGSDARYEAAWKAAVKLYWLLERKCRRPDELFVRIAGVNAEILFAREEETDALAVADPVLSVP